MFSPPFQIVLHGNLNQVHEQFLLGIFDLLDDLFGSAVLSSLDECLQFLGERFGTVVELDIGGLGADNISVFLDVNLSHMETLGRRRLGDIDESGDSIQLILVINCLLLCCGLKFNLLLGILFSRTASILVLDSSSLATNALYCSTDIQALSASSMMIASGSSVLILRAMIVLLDFCF